MPQPTGRGLVSRAPQERGSPERRLRRGALWLVLGAAPLAAVLAACDGGVTEPPFLPETSPTPTAIATPEATATVVLPSTVAPGTPTTAPGSPSIDESRTFATSIDSALTAGDGAFFADRGIQTEVTCAGEEQLGPCVEQPAGTVLRGIPGFVWRSDASWLFPPDEYAATLRDWFSSARPDLSDEYGDGGVTLFAIAQKSVPDEELLAIATAIRYTGPATEIQRQARVFRFVRGKGSWALRGEIFAAVSSTSEDWLSGKCAKCYDDWERWEGTAP